MTGQAGQNSLLGVFRPDRRPLSGSRHGARYLVLTGARLLVLRARRRDATMIFPRRAYRSAASGDSLSLGITLSDGRTIETAVPRPFSLSIDSTPPCSSTSDLANGKPRPVPS